MNDNNAEPTIHGLHTRITVVETEVRMFRDDISNVRADVRELKKIMEKHTQDEQGVWQTIRQDISRVSAKVLARGSLIGGIGIGLSVSAALIAALSHLGVIG